MKGKHLIIILLALWPVNAFAQDARTETPVPLVQSAPWLISLTMVLGDTHDIEVYQGESGPTLLVGPGLARTGCVLAVGGDPGAAARCVLEALAVVYGVDREAASAYTVRTTASVLPGLESAEMVRLGLSTRGVRVRDADVVVVFRWGRPVMVSGRPIHLLEPGPLVPRTAVPFGWVRSSSIAYDSRLARYVAEARSSSTSATVVRVLYDVVTGDVLETIPSRPAPANKLVNAHDFTASSASPTGPSPKVTQIDLTNTSGSNFAHDLDRTGSGYVSSTRIYNNPANCNASAYATITASQFAEPWSTISASDYRFPAATSFYWLGRIGDFRTHWSSGLGGPQTDKSLQLRLVPTECIGFNLAQYIGGPTTGILDLTATSEGAYNLKNIVHEYGHYIHDRYGSVGTDAVHEGFANTMQLSWQRYANEFRGELPGLSYNSGDATLSIQHAGHFQNGELLVDTESLYYPDGIACDPAESQANGDPNTCGRVVEALYWELSWDQCRLAYRPSNFGCSQVGQDIIQTGVYASAARRLANAALSYALINMVPTAAKVGDFGALMQAYYLQKKNDGTISQSDYDRVVSVFAHHCLGLAAYCSGHHLPGSPLPVSMTVKKNFVEAEWGSLANGSSVLTGLDSSNGSFVWLHPVGGLLTSQLNIPAGEAGVYYVRFVARRYGGSNAVVRVRTVPGTAYDITVGYGWAWYDAALFNSSITQTVEFTLISGSADIDAIVALQ